MKKFNQIISLLSLGVLPITIAGCDSKRATPHECKPIPPKPKPKPKPKPTKDPFKEILLKHSDLFHPFLLDWDSKLIMETFPSAVIRDYLIKNLAPKLKYDYTKVSFTGGKEVEKGEQPIIWYAIIQNDLTKVTALFTTTPHHHVGIDFWVQSETKK